MLAIHTNPETVQSYDGPEAAACKAAAKILLKEEADSDADDDSIASHIGEWSSHA